MPGPDGSKRGRGFVERFGLWDNAADEAGRRALKLVKDHDIEVVRCVFADQHGVPIGKTLVASAFGDVLRNGCAVGSSLFLKDTSGRTVYPVFTPGAGTGLAEMTGITNAIMVPDPATFHILPWAENTAWVLCDLYFDNGKPVPFSTRTVLKDALKALADAGYDYMSGLEVEFHLFKLEDAHLTPEHSTHPATPPTVSLLTHGYRLLSEARFDEIDPALTLIRRTVVDLGLPLRTIENEFGPTQVEVTFDPGIGLAQADMMVLFRSAVKQVCRRHGLHATFMCRPGLPNLFSSGWHLHQTLIDRKTGANAFVPAEEDAALSPLGLNFAAGLLEHAAAASVFTTPTINGYKRFRPYSLAPDRRIWGRDNRGAMIRAIGGAGDAATRLENRAGEPAANPYLYMASQIHAGLDGVNRGLDPGAPVDTPYEADAPMLPRSLIEALAALRQSTLYREALGDRFVDYIVTLKEAEVTRYLSDVTDWEHREYFDIF
ncbi:MAG TPA: glutamine synthetase family protein [Alphaproteobacteria bacterium]|nr:glutamine synthetase family protein [Alphaproteobacteria bacterium]